MLKVVARVTVHVNREGRRARRVVVRRDGHLERLAGPVDRGFVGPFLHAAEGGQQLGVGGNARDPIVEPPDLLRRFLARRTVARNRGGRLKTQELDPPAIGSEIGASQCGLGAGSVSGRWVI